MYVDLILNLALLVAISVGSGFVATRWGRRHTVADLMQGALFGFAAVMGMLRPVVYETGVIFDGRSVVISLCALYFGPAAAAVSAGLALAARMIIGGAGMPTGILVVLLSAVIGLAGHRMRRDRVPGPRFLYGFGLAVHAAMVAALMTLPSEARAVVFGQVAPLVILLFPVATVLAGQILSDQETSARSLAALRRTQERLQRAVHAGKVGLWEWDLATGRVFFSPEWKAQIGYAVDEIRDDFAEWEQRVHPDDRARAVAVADRLSAGDESAFEQQFRLRHKDGSYRHILARGSLVVDAAGRPAALIGSHVDITAQVDLQGQLLQAQKMETVGRLAGGIAHDFNNLLTVINGTAELVLDGLRHEDPLRADIEQIRDSGDRAAALTRQLLAFSRKQVLAPAPIDLCVLVRKMEGMLRRLVGVEIVLEVRADEDPMVVSADPGQIEQVLMNLVVNARDAMPDGGKLTLDVAHVRLDDASSDRPCPPGEYVTVAVSDTGIGMDPATQARIFEPFFTTKESGRGTGIGLSTAYGIATQSGGALTVASTPGQGSQFTLYLPRSAAAGAS